MAALVRDRDCTFACIINGKNYPNLKPAKIFRGWCGFLVWFFVYLVGYLVWFFFFCFVFYFARVYGSDSVLYFVTEATDNCDLPERF